MSKILPGGKKGGRGRAAASRTYARARLPARAVLADFRRLDRAAATGAARGRAIGSKRFGAPIAVLDRRQPFEDAHPASSAAMTFLCSRAGNEKRRIVLSVAAAAPGANACQSRASATAAEWRRCGPQP